MFGAVDRTGEVDWWKAVKGRILKQTFGVKNQHNKTTQRSKRYYCRYMCVYYALNVLLVLLLPTTAAQVRMMMSWLR